MIAQLLTACLLQGGAADAAPAGSPAPRLMPVTMQQCVYLAEANSLPLRAEEIDVQIAKAQIGQAIGLFDTSVFADVQYNKRISPTASALETGNLGAAATPEVQVLGILSKEWLINAGFRGTLTSGMTYQADIDWSKSFRSAGTFGNFNPAYTSGIGVSVTQPLLRNFGTTVNKSEVVRAGHIMQSEAEALEASRLQRANQVIIAYWDYYFAHRTRETRQFLVEQAEQLVRINRRKKEVGDMTQLQVIEAEADLAQRRQELIVAENEIDRTADALKRLIFPLEDPADWEVQLVPVTDASVADVTPPEWREAARLALERRPELRQQRELLKTNDIDIVVAENQLLPRLDLIGSLRFNTLAPSKGTVLNYTDDFYSIGGGVSFEMPLLNRVARYGLSIARLAKLRALLVYKELENQVIQEVRDAVREVINTQRQIEAAAEAVRLADKRWSDERTRQEVGYSTTFQVRDAEAQWLEAKDDELEAMFRFQLALSALDAAQGLLLERLGLLPAPRPELDDRAGIHYQNP